MLMIAQSWTNDKKKNINNNKDSSCLQPFRSEHGAAMVTVTTMGVTIALSPPSCSGAGEAPHPSPHSWEPPARSQCS